MEKISRINLYKIARLHCICNLVFFAAIFSACTTSTGQNEIRIVKNGDSYSSVFIPANSIDGVNTNKLEHDIIIKLMGNQESMLGEYSIDKEGVLFKPLIGFTPGNAYQVFFRGKVLANLTVPGIKSDHTVQLTGIYPSADTLPENLLKVYLKFSKPMRRGVSKHYLSMLNEKGDTLKNIFLNLESELWDEEGRQLTVWLDPGRIKRGLQPNEKDGNPLQKGNVYKFAISREWTDLRGARLDKDYTKEFVAAVKDVESPNPLNWELDIPRSGSPKSLVINFNESLDYALLSNTIIVTRQNGTVVAGKVSLSNKEKSWLFDPESNWISGTYFVNIESRLEDLAGNNLNRLFDRDLLKDKPAGTEQLRTRQFIIE